jgi:hypothetical protein
VKYPHISQYVEVMFTVVRLPRPAPRAITIISITQMERVHLRVHRLFVDRVYLERLSLTQPNLGGR